MKFFSLPKQEQLNLLGSMYEMMRRLPEKRVSMDTVMEGSGVRTDCGSLGCLAGWCAATTQVGKKLDIRWDRMQNEMRRRSTGDLIDFDTVFSEGYLNEFLFSPLSDDGGVCSDCPVSVMPEMELIKTKVDAKTLTGGFHRRMALLRLLYLGDLLANSEVSQDKIMSDLRNSFRTALYSKMMARKDLVAHVGLVQR